MMDKILAICCLTGLLPVFMTAMADGDRQEGNDSTRSPSASVWHQQHASGWFWYQQTHLEQSLEEPVLHDKSADVIKEVKEEDPRELLQAWRDQVEASLARAMLEPSASNVKHYMYLNEQSLARAGEFASTWQKVLRGTPELDYRLRYPADDASIQSLLHHDARTDDLTLQRLAEDHGLLFFFSSDCPVCHRFAPILRSFSHLHGFQVKAVSLDGGSLPDYPHPQINHLAAERLGVTAVPALFLVMPSTQQIRPIGYGLMGTSELGRRILSVAEDMRTPVSDQKYARGQGL